MHQLSNAYLHGSWNLPSLHFACIQQIGNAYFKICLEKEVKMLLYWIQNLLLLLILPNSFHMCYSYQHIFATWQSLCHYRWEQLFPAGWWIIITSYFSIMCQHRIIRPISNLAITLSSCINVICWAMNSFLGLACMVSPKKQCSGKNVKSIE